MDKNTKITSLMMNRGYWIMFGLLTVINGHHTNLEQGDCNCGPASAILILGISQTTKLLIWTTDTDKKPFFIVLAILVIAILDKMVLQPPRQPDDERTILDLVL